MSPVSICLYVIICLYFGFKGSGRIKNLKEFALGYKKISTAVLVATIYATHLGAGSTLGLIEQINNIGIVCAIIAILSVGRWYTTKAIVCKNINKFEGCLSQAHIMERLYGSFGFWISNVVNIISSVGYVAIQIVVIGFVAQYFYGFSPRVGTLLGSIVVTAYAASGGIKAVILTDLVQAILFGIVLVVLFFLSAQQVTEQPDFLSLIPESKAWILPYDGHSTLLVIGLIVYALLPTGTDAPSIQRVLISGSTSQLRKTFSYVALVDFMVILTLALVSILLLPATGTGTLNKLDIFETIKNNMPAVIVPATILGIMAVTMSTADSWLNSSAVMIVHSIVKKQKSLIGTQQVRLARLATIVLGSAAACMALSDDSVLSLLLITECLSTPLLFVPLAAGFLGYKCTEDDYKRSVVCAIIGVFIGGYIEGEFGFISLLFGLIGSTVGLAWKKKWRFRLPDGSSIIKLAKYRKVTPMFFAVVFGLALISGLTHFYIDQIWRIGDLALPGCIVIIMLALLIGTHASINHLSYKLCISITSFLLITALSSFAFRTENAFSIALLILTFVVVLIYRQYIPAMFGLTVGLMSISFSRVELYSPHIPLSVILLASSVFGALGFYITFKEIIDRLTVTTKQLAIEKMHATTDVLTKLYNRRYLEKTLTKMVRNAEERGRSFAVMMLDLDNFKALNDSYTSHVVGDAALRELARRIKKIVRPMDICTRFAGDEFIIIMPDAGLEEAKTTAERLRMAVAKSTFKIPAEPWQKGCTVSIGVTTFVSGDTKESLFTRVDNALFKAKKDGRNIVYATPLASLNTSKPSAKSVVADEPKAPSAHI